MMKKVLLIVGIGLLLWVAQPVMQTKGWPFTYRYRYSIPLLSNGYFGPWLWGEGIE